MYLSSSDFWQEFQKRQILSGKEREKITRAFSKYWLRSCTRCTPYGTFAGNSIVNITEGETSIILGESDQHSRHIRLDMNYIAEIIQSLLQLPHIRQQIKFFPNNSLYELPTSYRYAEYFIQNNSRKYELTSVEKTNYLKGILEYAETGVRMEELILFLAKSEGVEKEEANDFILHLLESQLLVSELEPSVTGTEPFNSLIEQLESLQGVDEIVLQCKEIQECITHPRQGVDYYQGIERQLGILGLVAAPPKNILQVDLSLHTQQNVLNKDLSDAIVKQIADLFPLAFQNKKGALEKFKDKFYAKFEEAEIALSIALDVDLGIAYANVNEDSADANEVIDNLAIAGVAVNSDAEFTITQKYTLYKYDDYLTNKKSFIEITEEELNDFKPKEENYNCPNSLYLLGSLLKENKVLSSRDFIFDLSFIGGPSAANLLGRFTHADKRLLDFAKDIVGLEERQYPDAIYAEIAHLPQSRAGNILIRPLLREYEIPYVGKSGAGSERQIPVGDLMVSMRNREIILRSKKHNRRVIPRLTTAHNYSHRSLPIYKFLCDLQLQGLAHPDVWDWGHLASLKFLPRVIYKNIIVKKAQWRIDQKDLKDLPERKEDYLSYFKEFRNKLGMPCRVLYIENDNKLLIDFEHERGVDLVLHYVNRNKSILLEEFLFTEDNCIVNDVKGEPFTNEIIIPIFREVQTIRSVMGKENQATFVKRKFSLYSEWLYFKVYCGVKMAERILMTVVLPFVEEGIKQKLFERFFFIRYKDDQQHIRIRFFNSDQAKQYIVQREFMQMLQPLLDNGSIANIMLDTYSREVERYGADLIEDSEFLFFSDSLSVLRFINLLEGQQGNKYRMLFALRGIDMLLEDFGFSLLEKKELLKMLQTASFKEQGGSPALQKQLNEKYRKYQGSIFSHMDLIQDANNEIEEGIAIFELRSEMNLPIIRRVSLKLAGDGKREEIFRFLANHIHMFMNRMFIANQRKYELVIYHFLDKYYASKVAMTHKK
jgi:thiopeptide-type bacteriocin biosynthesis protein